MRMRAVIPLLVVGACAWSNSLYQARLLSGNAVQAERERRPAEAQQLWGQVMVKADSAYARDPQGMRGAEALWLAGHAAAKINDCPHAIPRLQSAMSAGFSAPWRQQLLFELALCEEPLGGPTAASLYATLIASTNDPLIARRARLRLGHALIIREDWSGALAILAGDDTLPARLDRATAFAAVGRTDQALLELARPLAEADTSVRWLGLVEAFAAHPGRAADALLDRLLAFPNVGVELKSRWLLEGARTALAVDPAAADRRLQLLATRGSGGATVEGRVLQQQLMLTRSTTLPALRRAVDSLSRIELSDDGGGVRVLADLLRVARQLINRSDAISSGSVAGDLAMFGLAAQAHDSLGAPRLSAWFFQRLEREWPQSAYLAKAMLARAPNEPDSTDAILARARRLSTNPYVSAANGDVAGMVRVTQLEDSLGRYVDRMWAGRPERQ